MKKLGVIFRNFAKAPKNHKTKNSLRDFFLCVSGCLSDIDISKPFNVSGSNHLNEFFSYDSAHEGKNPTMPRNFVIRLCIDEVSYLKSNELSAVLLCKQQNPQTVP